MQMFEDGIKAKGVEERMRVQDVAELVAQSLPDDQERGARMSRPIYLDHHATTPYGPAVLDAMMPYLTESLAMRRAARTAMAGKPKRRCIPPASRLPPSLVPGQKKIILTSGATESD